VEADKVGESLGNVRLANTVLLGALSNTMKIPEQIWREVISKRVPKGTAEANLKAFEAGKGK
jgi:indolepyruvate ferredoxin oxidoreductase beta subunit